MINTLSNIYDPQMLKLIVDNKLQLGMDCGTKIRISKQGGKTEVLVRMQMSSSTLIDIIRKEESPEAIYEVVVVWALTDGTISNFHKNIAEYVGTVMTATLATQVIFDEEFPVMELTFKEV